MKTDTNPMHASPAAPRIASAQGCLAAVQRSEAGQYAGCTVRAAVPRRESSTQPIGTAGGRKRWRNFVSWSQNSPVKVASRSLHSRMDW